ncbi:hypothetical protein ACHHV8_16420 [Paenibacillus sp. TAB 01]|uniref:hypothetical protein n=1 Tax=Paenibacillus sp. TAB 01 TaxID=3368988 RepID=UPI003751FBCC
MNLIRQKTLAVVLMLLLVSPLLSGCWDQLEIDERGIVLGIGIDKSDHTLAKPEDVINHPSGKVLHITKVGLIKISVQIAVPGRIPLGPGEGGGGGGGGKRYGSSRLRVIRLPMRSPISSSAFHARFFSAISALLLFLKPLQD